MRRLRRIGLWVIIALVIAIVSGQRFGEPSLDARDGEVTVTLQLIDYGFHVALFVPREALQTEARAQGANRLVNIADRFADYQTLELGWGDESFYRSVPTIADLQFSLGVRAILGLNDKTVLLVVGHKTDVDAVYGSVPSATITISKRAFIRLIPMLNDTLAGGATPEELGPGLYGQSIFYRATGHYSLFNVCNHWTARLMLAAGRPVNLTLATLSRLLVWQMR